MTQQAAGNQTLQRLNVGLPKRRQPNLLCSVPCPHPVTCRPLSCIIIRGPIDAFQGWQHSAHDNAHSEDVAMLTRSLPLAHPRDHVYVDLRSLQKTSDKPRGAATQSKPDTERWNRAGACTGFQVPNVRVIHIPSARRSANKLRNSLSSGSTNSQATDRVAYHGGTPLTLKDFNGVRLSIVSSLSRTGITA